MREREGKGSNHEIVCVDSVIIFVPPSLLSSLKPGPRRGINFEKSLIKTYLSPPLIFGPLPSSILLFPASSSRPGSAL